MQMHEHQHVSIATWALSTFSCCNRRCIWPECKRFHTGCYVQWTTIKNASFCSFVSSNTNIQYDSLLSNIDVQSALPTEIWLHGRDNQEERGRGSSWKVQTGTVTKLFISYQDFESLLILDASPLCHTQTQKTKNVTKLLYILYVL